MMWRVVLWLTVVAAAFALNHVEDGSRVVLLDEPGTPEPLERILLLQQSVATVKEQHYHKLPGTLFDADAQDVKVTSEQGCRDICNDRGSGCQSFSYQRVTNECKVTPKSMAFDPGSVLSIKQDQGGYFQIPGLSFFHKGSSEWLPTAKTSDKDCAKLCTKSPDCHLYKFETATKRCSLSGKPIVFDPNWSCFSKIEAPEGGSTTSDSKSVQTQEEEVKKEQGEVKQLATEIQKEDQQLVKAKADVVKAKEEAAAKLEKEGEGDATLKAMKERLRLAKKSAEQAVVDNMHQASINSDAAKIAAKTELEIAQMDKLKETTKLKVAEDKKAEKAKEAEQMREITQHINKVEHQKEMAAKATALRANVTIALDEAQQEVSLANDADRALQDAKDQLHKQVAESSSQLRAQKVEMERSLSEAAAEMQARERSIEAMNRAAIKRAVELQQTRESGATNAELANITAIQKDAEEQRQINMTLLNMQLAAANDNLQKEEDQKAKLQADIIESRSELDRVHAKTRSIYAGILAAKQARNGERITTSNSETDPKITQMIEKAQKEAADAEQAAQAKADAQIREATEKAQKEKVKSDEVAAKAQERVIKAQEAKAKADRANLERLKSDYETAMNDAKTTAEEGLEEVKSVKNKAENLKDEKEATEMLEKAKAAWRAKVRAALNKASNIKESIPNTDVEIVVQPHVAISVELNKTIDHFNTTQAI